MQIISEDKAKERIAKLVAKYFDKCAKDKTIFINLGVGIPAMVADYITNPNVFVQAENGMLGVGKAAPEGQKDRNLINAGRTPITETVGCSFLDSATSFGMIRGGHIDATVIGAFEVDEEGTIANWIIPNGKQLGVGGAMDLVSGAKQVIIAMRHTTKKGQPKLVKKCKLPITGTGEADIIVTELGVFFLENNKLVLKQIAPEVTLDILSCITEADYEISPDLKVMDVD